MADVMIKVEGMSCGGCARNVTGVLMALPGVEDATVSLEQGSAMVSFDPAKIDVNALRQAVEDAGFDSPA